MTKTVFGPFFLAALFLGACSKKSSDEANLRKENGISD